MIGNFGINLALFLQLNIQETIHWDKSIHSEVESMQQCAVNNQLIEEKKTEPKNQPDQYFSVEISNSRTDFPYQFKLWKIASTPMCILVKEDSGILPCLKMGNRLNMKYHARDSVYPTEFRETAIRDINKNDQGRFKGHYLVHLEILEEQESALQKNPFSVS